MLRILRYLMEWRKDGIVFEEGWDVGRDEEECCDLVYCLKVFYSPRRRC